jgi:hypothetical protein
MAELFRFLVFGVLVFGTVSAVAARGGIAEICPVGSLKKIYSCEEIRSAKRALLTFPDGEVQFNTLPLGRQYLGSGIDKKFDWEIHRYEVSALNKRFNVNQIFFKLRAFAAANLVKKNIGPRADFLFRKIRSMKLFVRGLGDPSCSGANEFYPAAAYDVTTNMVGICPVAAKYNELSTAITLAHEISHSIDQRTVDMQRISIFDESLIKPARRDLYVYPACVDSYRVKTGYRGDNGNPLGPYPFFERLRMAERDHRSEPNRMDIELERLKKISDPDAACYYKNGEKAFELGIYHICQLYSTRCTDGLSYMTRVCDGFAERTRIPANRCFDILGKELAVDYNGEWLADALGAEILDQYLAVLRRFGTVYRYTIDQAIPIFYQFSCDETRATQHPIGQTRLRTFLNGSPELRKVVGCAR